MSDSLRDQLLKAGFKPQPRPQSKPQAQSSAKKPATPNARRPQPQPHAAQKPKPRDAEIDLARAYALRDRNEREERERAQREAEQRARERKERRQKLVALLEGKTLNAAEAEIPRHFPYSNKIRRIYVTADQLPRLNGGELAVVQLNGRYLLVAREVGIAAGEIDADALALLCDPHDVDEDGVPADLVW